MISADKIYGLILSGGRSTRMGQDKGLIPYHGVPQREYLYHLLEGLCERTFLSVRSDQESETPSAMELIKDRNRFKGPFNGMLSAHLEYPGVAWLVVACDMPLLDKEALKLLINARDREKTATAYTLKTSDLPEPLCAIWEPEALKQAVEYLEAGNGSCPRKFLINSRIKQVHPTDDRVLINANSREDYLEVLAKHL